MEPWGLVDVLVYFSLALFIQIKSQNILNVLVFVLGVFLFVSVYLPLRLFITFHVHTYDRRGSFAQVSSYYGFLAILSLKWMLKWLNVGNMGQVLFGQKLALWMFQFRKVRNGASELGDIDHLEYKTPQFSGYWMGSKKRDDEHDLIVIFVPGVALGLFSVYVYMEFVALLIRSLQGIGFKNPAIFVLDTHESDATYSGNLTKLIHVQADFTEMNPNSKVVLMGSGVGGTICLSYLLHCVNPNENLPKVEKSAVAATVLISPFTQLQGILRNDTNFDFVSSKATDKHFRTLLASDQAAGLIANPGRITNRSWWAKAIPPCGLYAICGKEETAYREADHLFKALSPLGNVSLEVEERHVHAWPIYRVYTGRDNAARTEGTDRLALQISMMVLWTSN